jgi:hypothetical protein
MILAQRRASATLVPAIGDWPADVRARPRNFLATNLRR